MGLVDEAIQLLEHFTEYAEKNPNKIYATVMLFDPAKCNCMKDTFLRYMTKTKGITYSHGNDVDIDYYFTRTIYMSGGELRESSRKTSFLQIKENLESQHPNTEFDLFVIEDKSSWEITLEKIGYDYSSIRDLTDKVRFSDKYNGTFTSCISSKKYLIIKYNPLPDKSVNADSNDNDT